MPSSAKKKNKKHNYKPYFVHYLYCLAIIILLIVAGVNVNNYINNQKVLGTSIDATSLQNEKDYWLKIVSVHPTYVDGYLELAKVDIEIGDKKEAQVFVNKAIDLDPNSIKIPKVISKLNL